MIELKIGNALDRNLPRERRIRRTSGFKTIADFRRDNRAAFRPEFRQFVVLCKQLGLFGRELLAVDGTRIKAVNNKDRNFTRASLAEIIRLADEKLDGYLPRLDSSDAAEQATGDSRVKNLSEKIAAVRERRARCQEMLAELDRTGEKETDLPYRSRQSGDGCTHACRRRLQPCRSRWMLSTS